MFILYLPARTSSAYPYRPAAPAGSETRSAAERMFRFGSELKERILRTADFHSSRAAPAGAAGGAEQEGVPHSGQRSRLFGAGDMA
jgi:hypothetical protein